MSETDKDKHDQALDLTEQALEAIDKGDERQADRLIEKAKKLDPSAPAEVVEDLDKGCAAVPLGPGKSVFSLGNTQLAAHFCAFFHVSRQDDRPEMKQEKTYEAA